MVENLVASLTQGGTELSKRVLSGVCNNSFHRLEPTLPFEVDLDEYKKVPRVKQWAKGVDLSKTESWCEGYFR